MKDPDDSELAEACLAGDTEAFALWVDRHRDAVYNLAYRMCGNAATAEDVAQEAFVRAYRRLRQYKPQFPFRNWVLGICAHLCRSGFRGWRRRRDLEQRYAEDEALQAQGRPESADEEKRRKTQVDRALAALPETLRLPVVLKYMEGMTVEEIASTLGIGHSAVKMRLARGREQMEVWLRDAGGGDEP